MVEKRNYKEQVEQLCKEAFNATKELLKNNGERKCIYFPECDDSFEAIVYCGSFTDDMEGFVGKGVKLDNDGELQVRVGNTTGSDYWTSADDINSLCYADMYDFVARNIDNAMTEEEAVALEENEETGECYFGFEEGDDDEIMAANELIKRHYDEDKGVNVESLAWELGCDTESDIFKGCTMEMTISDSVYEFRSASNNRQPLYQILNAICVKYPSIKYGVN